MGNQVKKYKIGKILISKARIRKYQDAIRAANELNLNKELIIQSLQHHILLMKNKNRFSTILEEVRNIANDYLLGVKNITDEQKKLWLLINKKFPDETKT